MLKITRRNHWMRGWKCKKHGQGWRSLQWSAPQIWGPSWQLTQRFASQIFKWKNSFDGRVLHGRSWCLEQAEQVVGNSKMFWCGADQRQYRSDLAWPVVWECRNYCHYNMETLRRTCHSNIDSSNLINKIFTWRPEKLNISPSHRHRPRAEEERFQNLESVIFVRRSDLLLRRKKAVCGWSGPFKVM